MAWSPRRISRVPAEKCCAGKARVGWRLRGNRGPVAGVSRIDSGVSHQLAAGAHHRELELQRFGTRGRQRPASSLPSRMPHLSCGRIGEDTAENREISQHDADVFAAYEEHLERLSQVVESLLLTTPPEFPPRGVATSSTI